MIRTRTCSWNINIKILITHTYVVDSDAVATKGKIHRGNPKFVSCPSSLTENYYIRVLQLTQILGQPCAFQTPVATQWRRWRGSPRGSAAGRAAGTARTPASPASAARGRRSRAARRGPPPRGPAPAASRGGRGRLAPPAPRLAQADTVIPR
jgi:hypothetical protein